SDCLNVVRGQEPIRPGNVALDPLETSMNADPQHLNIELKTLGGRQFWGDVAYFRGWRIQQNVLTGHYRLLDPHDVRKAWGTLEECQTKLEKFRIDQQLPPMNGTAVVLTHGIIRSSKSFAALQKQLEAE